MLGKAARVGKVFVQRQAERADVDPIPSGFLTAKTWNPIPVEFHESFAGVEQVRHAQVLSGIGVELRATQVLEWNEASP